MVRAAICGRVGEGPADTRKRSLLRANPTKTAPFRRRGGLAAANEMDAWRAPA